MSEQPASITTSSTPANPSSQLNPAVGIKFPDRLKPSTNVNNHVKSTKVITNK